MYIPHAMPRYVIDPTKELHQIGSILEAFPFQVNFVWKTFNFLKAIVDIVLFYLVRILQK